LQLGKGTFQGKQVIDAGALAETHRPPKDPATDRAGFYGLGWNVNYDDHRAVRLNHSGAFALGAATNVSLLPAEGVGIVVLTNAAPIGVPEALCASFLDLAQTGKVAKDYLTEYQQAFAVLGKPTYGTAVDYAKPPAQASPAAPVDAYVGTYANPYFGEIQIVAKDGGLALRQGAKPADYPMTHYDRDVFSYQPTGESSFGPSGVTFTVGASGKASGVLIENLNIYGQGEFGRVQPRQ
jgi:Domain of unknown function (DUF3471)/Beta-lactamase